MRPKAALVSIVLFGCVSGVRADDPKWKLHSLNGRSEFEAAGVMDVDNDGKLDVVSGELVPGPHVEGLSGS